jgi:hypothetical protein
VPNVTCDLSPQKSSLAVTQTSPPHVPVYTESLVSKEAAEQVLSVSDPPEPMNVYHTPGWVDTPEQLGATSGVADTDVPLIVCPQLILMAAEQSSLTGGQLIFNVNGPVAPAKP